MPYNPNQAQIDDESMWLAASILEAEAMYLPTIEAEEEAGAEGGAAEGEGAAEGGAAEGGAAKALVEAKVTAADEVTSGSGEMDPGETDPGAMDPGAMEHGEWLAHMAAAEYSEMPDHMPSVWYA